MPPFDIPKIHNAGSLSSPFQRAKKKNDVRDAESIQNFDWDVSKKDRLLKGANRRFSKSFFESLYVKCGYSILLGKTDQAVWKQ